MLLRIWMMLGPLTLCQVLQIRIFVRVGHLFLVRTIAIRYGPRWISWLLEESSMWLCKLKCGKVLSWRWWTLRPLCALLVAAKVYAGRGPLHGIQMLLIQLWRLRNIADLLLLLARVCRTWLIIVVEVGLTTVTLLKHLRIITTWLIVCICFLALVMWFVNYTDIVVGFVTTFEIALLVFGVLLINNTYYLWGYVRVIFILDQDWWLLWSNFHVVIVDNIESGVIATEIRVT